MNNKKSVMFYSVVLWSTSTHNGAFQAHDHFHLFDSKQFCLRCNSNAIFPFIPAVTNINVMKLIYLN